MMTVPGSPLVTQLQRVVRGQRDPPSEMERFPRLQSPNVDLGRVCDQKFPNDPVQLLILVPQPAPFTARLPRHEETKKDAQGQEPIDHFMLHSHGPFTPRITTIRSTQNSSSRMTKT